MVQPVFAAHMMISLKAAAAETTGELSLLTITNTDNRRLPADGGQSLRFASPMLNVSHGTPGTSTTPDEEDVELDSIPRHRNIDLKMTK